MKINLLVVLTFISLNILNAQNIWTKISFNELEAKEKVNRSSIPNKAEYFKLDIIALKNILVNAPERFLQNAPDLIVQFPNSEGVLEKFKVVNSPILHPDLAAKYPMIQTYAAQGIEDPTAFMRFSVTQFGLHTMCLSGTKSTTFIDPFTSDRNYYIVYDKNSLGKDAQGFECFTDETAHLPSIENDRAPLGAPKAINDQKFRIFRLAQSCTAEYGNIFANTGTELADIQAQMALTINRVNTVYEIDLGIQLQFVADNDEIIYFGSTTTDPWSNEWNTKTAQTIDAAIGVNNYDIGHNFNANSGGNAGCIGCVCLSNSQSSTHKGRGYTGRSNPTGDPFDIDYVAHEMGHQFGGYHTQSNSSCRSGSGSTEVEPGSGSSIMGYAGICAADVQDHSDAHFNYVNIRDISANIKIGGNSTCAQIVTTTNSPPTANAGADYTIPKSTAFILEGIATDANGTASLTYNWSQNDPENPNSNNAPPSTRTQGPMYRSILPTTSPNRYMPNISDVLAGNLTPTWEVTPSVARNLEFAFMVRDNTLNGAQTADDLMSVTVSGTAGPFQVTSQNTNQNWETGQTQTVTWNVASTNTGAVNTPNVNIFLSLDGGYTYPITLASGVPNNGSANVTIPSSAVSNTCRIMVRGAGNIFYALNGANINIQPGDFLVNFTSTNAVSCLQEDVVYNFVYTPQNGFVENTVFSVSNLPTGVTATFVPASSTNATNVTLTLSNISSANVGVYSLFVNAVATSSSQVQTLSLDISESPTIPSLNSPANTALSVATNPTFSWAATAGNSVTYTIEIATDVNFINIIDNASNLTANTYTALGLANGTIYFWRVKTLNDCGQSSFSSAFSFTTSTCFEQTSVDVPIAITSFGANTITSELIIASSGTISDLNVIDIQGQHTRVGHLTVSITSPAGTTAQLWGGICGNQNDFILNFDDAAATATIPCPPTSNGFYIPTNALSVFNGENIQGTWTLTVVDNANQGGGSLDNWALAVCLEAVPCVAPDMPIISASDNVLCQGENTTLTISQGNLYGATDWQWYSGTCGGTVLSAGNSLSVSPNSTETYYARGEGGCIADPGTCGSLEITVNNIYNFNLNQTANDSAEINGVIYYASQVVSNAFQTVEGCDSIVKTNLTIIEQNPDGIFDLNKENLISIYPNPNTGSFNIKLSDDVVFNAENELIIYNVLGQKVFSEKNFDKNILNIDLKNPSKGIYHVVFKNNLLRISKDVIIF